MGATAYTVLGVESTATAEEIKAAYRRLATANHPDVGGDPAKMARVNLAWQYLGDPEARAKYDHRLADLERAASATSTTPHEAEESIDAFLERLRKAQAAGINAGDLVAELGRAVGFSDQGGLSRAQQAATKGANIARDVADLVGLIRGFKQ